LSVFTPPSAAAAMCSPAVEGLPYGPAFCQKAHMNTNEHVWFQNLSLAECSPVCTEWNCAWAGVRLVLNSCYLRLRFAWDNHLVEKAELVNLDQKRTLYVQVHVNMSS
jgi:hypothetical protein